MTSPVIENTEMNFKDWLPLISSSVVIILFIIDRLINSKVQKKEVERTWYYKILLEPNLNSINNFFNSLENSFMEEAEFILTSIDVSHEEYLRCQRQAFQRFKIMKRKMELEVILPILKTYPNTGQALTNKLLEIEDVYTSALDNLEISESDISNVSNELYKLRAEWLYCLYTPVYKKKLA